MGGCESADHPKFARTAEGFYCLQTSCLVPAPPASVETFRTGRSLRPDTFALHRPIGAVQQRTKVPKLKFEMSTNLMCVFQPLTECTNDAKTRRCKFRQTGAANACVRHRAYLPLPELRLGRMRGRHDVPARWLCSRPATGGQLVARGPLHRYRRLDLRSR